MCVLTLNTKEYYTYILFVAILQLYANPYDNFNFRGKHLTSLSEQQLSKEHNLVNVFTTVIKYTVL